MNDHRYGVALSHASVATCGPDLVVSRRATRAEADREAALTMHAQPGTVAVVAEHDGDTWRIDGQTVREWIDSETKEDE